MLKIEPGSKIKVNCKILKKGQKAIKISLSSKTWS